MRNGKKKVITLFLLLALLASILSGCKGKAAEDSDKEATSSEITVTEAPKVTTAPAEPTAVPVSFTDLGPQEITAAMSPGWNLGNQLEAGSNRIPSETAWGNPVIKEELIKAVKAAGFKSIRIPVSYLDLIGAGPDYTISEDWLNRIQKVVDYVVNNGLYAVINIHGDGFQSVDGGWLYCDAVDQDTVKAKFKAIWTQIAARFKDYDEHLIFEDMNEISDMSYADPKPELYEVINSYNQLFLDTIRQTGGFNDRRWVLMPGWNTDIAATATEGCGFVIPKENYLSDQVSGASRIMISVHDYSPWDFCGGDSGEITQWGENAKDPAKTSTHSGQSFMAAQFKLLFQSFTSKGYPVVIGEYGVVDKTGDDPENAYYRNYYNVKMNENCLKYGCISMYWDNGYNTAYGFGIFDRTSCTVTQQGIIDAIMQVYNPVSESGNSTGITLDKSEATMYIGDAAMQLNAVITPVDSTDTIHWSSSDETILTVSDQGLLRPQVPGTAVITASANGNKAECTVNVYTSPNIQVMLYAIETATWSTIHSDSSVELTKDGGSFTLSMSGSADVLGNIGSLFIKDVSVQSGVAQNSVFQSCMIKIDSFRFNDTEIPVTNPEAAEAINEDSGALDYWILNQWVDQGARISNVDKNAAGSYQFSGIDYQDNNTIEITFTVTGVVKPD